MVQQYFCLSSEAICCIFYGYAYGSVMALTVMVNAIGIKLGGLKRYCLLDVMQALFKRIKLL